MNSFKYILPLLVLPLGISPIDPNFPIDPIEPGKPDIIGESWVINTSKMGPYLPKQEDYIKVYIKNQTQKGEEIEFFMVIDTKTNGKLPLLNKKHLYVEAKSSITLDIHLTNFYLTDLGLTYELKVLSSDRSKTYANAVFSYFPFQQLTANINEITDKKVVLKSQVAWVVNNKPFYLQNEIFDFSNTILTFEEATYYYLDITKFKFTYNSLSCPTILKATLKMVDRSRLFPNLAPNRVVFLPLKININKNKEVYFSFANQLFVNPNSLSMSNRNLPGYIATNKFYLPRKGSKLFDKYKIEFIIDEIGVNKSNFRCTLNYFYNKNLLGDCANSDFCVVGGVSND